MDVRPRIDVAILGAVSQEVSALTDLLNGCRLHSIRCQNFWIGKYSGLSVLVGTTGLGKVNAAITTTSLLERFSIAQVWNIGCSGAYPGGPIQTADVLITDHALCGDEGVLTQAGVLPLSEIGIPLIVFNGKEYYDSLPLHWEGNLQALIDKTPPGIYRQKRGAPPACAILCAKEHEEERQRSCDKDLTTGTFSPSSTPLADDDRFGPDEDFFRLIYGPSLSLSMASGDPEVAARRFQHYCAHAENMEGSAVVQTCLRFGIQVMECRGISNIAGVRSKETWQLEKSIAHCHGIIINCLDTLISLKLLD
jgi:futalosine hydrolase